MTMKSRVLCAVSKGEESVRSWRISCVFLLDEVAYEVLREETPSRVSRKPAARPESRPPEPPQNHATNVTEKPELPVAGSTGQNQQPPNEVSVPVAVPGVPETQQNGKSEINGADREAQAASAPLSGETPKAPEARPVQAQEATLPEPPQAPPKIAEVPQDPQPPQRTTPPRQDGTQKHQQSETAAAPEAPAQRTQDTLPPPKPDAQESTQEASEEPRAPQRTSPRDAKGERQQRKAQEEQPPVEDVTALEAAPEHTQVQQESQVLQQTSPKQDAKGKRARRDSPKEQPAPEQTAPEAAVDEAARPSQPPQPPQQPDAQEQADEQQRPQPEKRISPQGPKGKRKRQQVPEEQPPKDTTAPEPTSGRPPQEKPDVQEHVEEGPSKPRDKRQKGRPPASARSSDKGKEPENRAALDRTSPTDGAKDRELPEATEEPSQVEARSKDDSTETRARSESPKAAAGRKRAGRPKKKTTRSEPREQEEAATSRAEQTEPTKSTAAPEQPEASEEEEGSQPTRKRQSRGETVPVTVHRLANLASLGGIPGSDSDSDGSSESADELSTRQKTKHPSRGGVNQADVLNQICRETLEKTLTTLKNGIANESNATRKAEWTRKKKAVEAFGSELEGRLFEMSEMLDSNFVLGVKLRRAKSEMMEMRSRLYHVRREREAIAVRMDDVRRKFVEEERARIVRLSFFLSFFPFSSLFHSFFIPLYTWPAYIHTHILTRWPVPHKHQQHPAQSRARRGPRPQCPAPISPRAGQQQQPRRTNWDLHRWTGVSGAGRGRGGQLAWWWWWWWCWAIGSDQSV